MGRLAPKASFYVSGGVLVAAAWLTMGTAQGGSGFVLRSQSATTLGSAQAGMTAGAEDVTSMIFNPAALARGSGFEGAVVGTGIFTSATFSQSSAATLFGTPIIGSNGGNDGTQVLIPSLYFSVDLPAGFRAGLAVTSLGHSHPAVAQALSDQAATLLHVSNLFGTVPGPQVAATLDRLMGGGGKVFFTNSGAEANECAIKLARKHGGAPAGCFKVISAFGSFHGRTLATLHATGQPAKHEPFQPLPDGFVHVAWDDLDALDRAIDPSVAAVMLEPVQGEGGVNPATAEYFRGVRDLCTERGVLFMVDEVQTGLGRCGAWFAHQHFGVVPDVVTMAKALGNGVPRLKQAGSPGRLSCNRVGVIGVNSNPVPLTSTASGLKYPVTSITTSVVATEYTLNCPVGDRPVINGEFKTVLNR